MPSPTVRCEVNFSTGASFGYPMILDQGLLDTNVLGDAVPNIVDVTDQIQAVSVSRGFNNLSQTFQTGTAAVRIADQLGYWNPQNLSSPYAGDLLPLRKIQIFGVDNNTVPATEYPLFSGYITGYNYTQSQRVGEVNYTTLTAVDGFRLLQLAGVIDVPGSSAGDLTGTRVDQILDAIAWPAGQRDVDAGLTTVQDDDGSSRTALQALNTVTLTEFGALYIDTLGRVTFQDRNVTAGSVGGTPTVFADDGTGIKYQQCQWVLNDAQVFNQAKIQRTGGALQTSTNQASIDKYFLHSYEQTGLIMQTDTVALDWANAFVAARQETTVRCQSVTLDLMTENYATGVEAGLSLDFFDQITVKQTQPDSTLEQTLQVFGVRHEINQQNWLTTFNTDEPLLDAFLLNNADWGVLDQNVLSY